MPRGATLVLLALLLPAPGLRAQEEPPAAEQPAGPEEPDFFFLTSGPYTQKKNSPQIIWANQWFRDRQGLTRTQSYTGAGRFEWGLTEFLEADLEFGAVRVREREAEAPSFAAAGADDVMVGIRYRLLREPRFPFTLTTGPQVIAPVASRRRGLGSGRVGYAWDIAAAKDWGGPVFLVASLNLRWTPDVPAFPDGSGPRLDLSAVRWGTALGFRALERRTAEGANHDLHVLLEVGGAREDDLEGGRRVRSTPVQFAPGVRYGFLRRSGSLAEIGVSFPVGLTGAAPDWGFLLQLQFELPSLFGVGP